MLFPVVTPAARCRLLPWFFLETVFASPAKKAYKNGMKATVENGAGKMGAGTIFTLGDKFRNCFRLIAAFWSGRIEQAVETLGAIAEGFAATAPGPQEKKR